MSCSLFLNVFIIYYSKSGPSQWGSNTKTKLKSAATLRKGASKLTEKTPFHLLQEAQKSSKRKVVILVDKNTKNNSVLLQSFKSKAVLTSLMFSGLPLRSCLFIVSIAFFTNSSSLNSTTLLNQGEMGQTQKSPRKCMITKKWRSMLEKVRPFLTHSPNQGAS